MFEAKRSKGAKRRQPRLQRLYRAKARPAATDISPRQMIFTTAVNKSHHISSIVHPHHTELGRQLRSGYFINLMQTG